MKDFMKEIEEIVNKTGAKFPESLSKEDGMKHTKALAEMIFNYLKDHDIEPNLIQLFIGVNESAIAFSSHNKPTFKQIEALMETTAHTVQKLS